MPLSSITTGGGGPGILDFAALLTGNTAKQREQSKLDSFINNDLPSIANDIHSATTAEDVQKHAQRFITGGLKAGINPQQLDKLGEMLVQPALNNLGAGEYEKLGAQLQPQTTAVEKPVNLPAISGPFGPGLEQANLTAPELTTTPGRPFSQGDALKLAEIQARTGVKAPQGLSSLIGTPSAIDERQAQAEAANQLASRRKVQRQLEERQIETLEGLPEGEIGDTGITTRQLGLSTKGSGLTGYINESRKEAAQAPVRESQVTLNAARTNQANAQADRARQLAKQVGGRAQMTALRAEYLSMGGDPEDVDGYLNYVEKRSAAGRKPSELAQIQQIMRGGANRSTAPAGSKPAGKPTAQSVLDKYGVR